MRKKSIYETIKTENGPSVVRYEKPKCLRHNSLEKFRESLDMRHDICSIGSTERMKQCQTENGNGVSHLTKPREIGTLNIGQFGFDAASAWRKKMRESIDSREGFDSYTPTPEDWAEYEVWLDSVEESL